MTSNKDALYEWLFHFNPYQGYWYAFKREDSVKFFNDKYSVTHFASCKHQDIVDFILKENTNG
jgi:hypothetical protein